MTARTASPGLSGRAVPLVVAMAAIAAVGSYGITSVAASRGSAVFALAMVAAPAYLLLAALRPDLGALMIPALVFSNAGLVLNINYSVPNIMRATMIVVLATLLINPEWRHRTLLVTPVLAAGGLFVAVRILSAVQSPGAPTGSIFMGYVFGLLVVVVVAAICAEGKGLRATALVVVAVAALIATATILRRAGLGGTWFGFAGDTPITNDVQEVLNRSGNAAPQQDRVAGPVTDPNFWAQMLVLALPMSLWAIQRRSTWASRGLAVAAAFAIIVGIEYTQSRGGLIAGIIAVAIWLWMQGGRYRKALWVLPVLVTIVLSTSSASQRFSELSQVTNPTQASDESIRGRLSENIAAYQMWRDHPVLGVGAEQYPANYRRYAAKIGLDDRVGRNAHNSYLQMAAEAGTLGLAAFVGMFVTGLVVATRVRRRLLAARWEPEAQLTGAVLAGLVGYALGSVFLHQAWPDYLWLALGMIGGAWLLAERVAPRNHHQEAA